MAKLTIEMPATVKVAMGKDSGQFLTVDIKRMVPFSALWIALITAGIKTILTNVYNGGGKDAKHDVKMAAAQKKLDAWYRGEFNIVERGDSMLTAMKEAYIDDIRSKQEGASIKDVEESIKATVSAVYGEKETATFGKFLDAMGTLLHKQDDSQTAEQHREAMESYLAGLVEESAKKRSAVAAKLDVTGLALAAFAKKPAADTPPAE